MKNIGKHFEVFLEYDMQQDYFYKINCYKKLVGIKSYYYEIELQEDVLLSSEELIDIIVDRFLDYIDKFKIEIKTEYEEEIVNWVYDYVCVYGTFYKESFKGVNND